MFECRIPNDERIPEFGLTLRIPFGIQDKFKNRRKSRSRRGNEAEVFFAPKSASLRRRLPFLNSSSFRESVFVIRHFVRVPFKVKSKMSKLRGSAAALAEYSGLSGSLKMKG